MFAVSELAANYTFGNNAVKEQQVRIVKNGIDIKNFIFNMEQRLNKRQELNLENKCIIGHIGRFMEQKNHMFLLEVFKELLNYRTNVHLLLVGEGNLEGKIRDKIKKLDIDDKVSILGRRIDIGDLMKAMDLFLFPSFYEGFGNVVMEAEAAALPILMASTISDEVIFTEYVHKMSLNKGAKKWAETIDYILRKNMIRRDMSVSVSNAGHNIIEIAKWYEKYYLDLYKRI